MTRRSCGRPCDAPGLEQGIERDEQVQVIEASNDAILSRLERWAAVMRTAMEAPNGVRALAVVLRYISEVSDVRADELQRKVLAVLGAKGKDAMTTAADTWREEGRVEGERRLVLRLLSARFGELPAAAVARVNAAEVPELDRWAEQVLVATTLESVLGSS